MAVFRGYKVNDSVVYFNEFFHTVYAYRLHCNVERANVMSDITSDDL